MRRQTLLAIFAIISSIYYFTYGEPYMAKHYAYPLKYEGMIQKAGKEYNVSRPLIAAVILAESKFQEDAESEPGAMGLMQLMPDTAHWIVEQLNQPKLTDRDIKEPSLNIQMGTWYLGYLLEEFKGNKVLALAAYNAGRGHVEEWMTTYQWDYSFNDIDQIPFGETRSYVRKVLDHEAKYQVLYMF